MCEAFVAAGHEVMLFAKKHPTEEVSQEQIAQYYGVGCRFSICLLKSYNIWFVGGVLYGSMAAAAMAKSGFCPDIIYGRNIFALLACTDCDQARIVFESHAAPYNRGREMLERLLFARKNFSGLITISKSLQNYYLQRHPLLTTKRRIWTKVLPDGADRLPADFTGLVRGRIGYAGSLFPGKGVETILEIAKKLPELEFHIAGGSSNDIERLTSNDKPANVVFHGRLAPSNVASFLKSCEILLAPYQQKVSTTPDGNGDIAAWMSPLKIFEYMASCRPLIATRLPVIQEILTDNVNALLVEPENVCEWVKAVKRLSGDNSLRHRLAATANEDLCSRYSWKSRAEKIVSLTAQADKPAVSPLIRCLHVVNDLDHGGAEQMLCRLVLASDSRKFSHSVISLRLPGPLSQQLENAGIKVRTLRLESLAGFPEAMLELIGIIRKTGPDLLHSWMYYSDIMAGIASIITGFKPVIFGIRHGDTTEDSLKTHLSAKVAALMTHLVAEKVVSCSDKAAKAHCLNGYKKEKIRVIHNGYVPAASESPEWLRQRLKVAESVPLIGLIARYDPVKDHKSFIAAAALVHRVFPEAEFVLCGHNVSSDNYELSAMIASHNMQAKFHLLGFQKDIGRVLCALRFLVSASITEAFPNVVAEAMNGGIPCVVTDVGESAHIVGNTGIIVPPRNPVQLAAAMCRMLACSREELTVMAAECRRRIHGLFALPAMVQKYEETYIEVLNAARKPN
jgi:glycosyltransferase involved in cell wall biosynthesis